MPSKMETSALDESQRKTKFAEAIQLFNVFVVRVSELNEKHRVASKFFLGFQQELEKLRQPSLQESSELVFSLLQSHQTARTKKYEEAGFRHVHSDQKAILKLNEFIKSLKEHIAEAQVLVHQLEELVLKVLALVDDDLNSCFDNGSSIRSICQFKKNEYQEFCSAEYNLTQCKASDYAIIMSAVLNMYEKDLQMQELIISDSRLDVDSERLQTYGQMWLLRPLINDNVIDQILKWASR